MKLAEALSLRKDLETKISKLRERLANNVRIQEGEEPAEDPEELLTELDTSLVQLEKLIYNINVTNIQLVTKDGRQMTKMLAERDVLSKRIKVLQDTLDRAMSSNDRYSRSELRYITTIDIKALHQQLDKYSQKYRQLDMQIQQLNFMYDLVE